MTFSSWLWNWNCNKGSRIIYIHVSSSELKMTKNHTSEPPRFSKFSIWDSTFCHNWFHVKISVREIPKIPHCVNVKSHHLFIIQEPKSGTEEWSNKRRAEKVSLQTRCEWHTSTSMECRDRGIRSIRCALPRLLES